MPQWRETIPFEATPELLTALFGHVESVAAHQLDLRLDAARRRLLSLHANAGDRCLCYLSFPIQP